MTHLADLHPTHATEPTPVFYEALRAHNLAAVTREVRQQLADVSARGPRQKSPTRLRILNESPLLYAVTGGA